MNMGGLSSGRMFEGVVEIVVVRFCVMVVMEKENSHVRWERVRKRCDIDGLSQVGDMVHF